MLATTAPAAITRRKARYSELDEAATLRRGLEAMAMVDVPTPIVDPVLGRIVALARGRQSMPGRLDRRVDYITDPVVIREVLRAGFPTYDSIWNAVSSGFQWPAKIVKTATTAPVAGQYMDLWPVGGDPTAGTYTGAASTLRQFNDTTTGALQHGGNVSTATKHVVNAFLSFSAGATPPTVYLYDRVATYEAVPFNAAVNAAFTNTLAATRYVGAGEGGLKVMVTCQTVLGATASNITQLQYTDQDENTLQSMPTTVTCGTIVSAAAPTATLGARVIAPATGTTPFGPYVFLAAGDSGVRLLANLTTSAANTGTLAFVLLRQLAVFPGVVAGKTEDFDLTRGLQALPRIRDGACLAAFARFPVATGTNFELDVTPAWN